MPIKTLETLIDVDKWLIVPSRQLVLWTLHTLDERCPNCRMMRNASDMIFIDPYTAPTAVCWYCAPTSQICKDKGTATVLRESGAYIDSIVQAVDPAKWGIQLPRKNSGGFTVSYASQLASEAAAWSIIRCNRENKTKDVHGTFGDSIRCGGTYSRNFMGDYGDVGSAYIDSHAKCFYEKETHSRVHRFLFSAMGTTCTKCVKRRCNRGAITRSKMLDIKMRQRLACEGLRYAVWLGMREDYLIPNMWPGGTADPVRIPWIDWLTGDVVSTSNAEDCIPLNEYHRRVKYRF